MATASVLRKLGVEKKIHFSPLAVLTKFRGLGKLGRYNYIKNLENSCYEMRWKKKFAPIFSETEKFLYKYKNHPVSFKNYSSTTI